MEKEYILREKLAIQRTILANQSTLLSFLRTSMYFLIAGLGIDTLVHSNNGLIYEIILFTTSLILCITGIVNYYFQKNKINESETQINEY